MKYFLILCILISIVGCSKNDSESNDQDNSSSVDNGQDNSSTLDYAAAPTPVEGALTGTAALGAPLIKSNVKVKCANGTELSGTTNSFGKWSIAVSGKNCDAPFLIKVDGDFKGQNITLLSSATNEDVSKIVNVTPITHIITSELIAKDNATDAYSNISNQSISDNISKTKIQNQEGFIKTALTKTIQAATDETDLTKIDLINTGFATNHTGLDSILDLTIFEILDNNSIALKSITGIDVVPHFKPSNSNLNSLSSANDNLSKLKSVKSDIIKIKETLSKYVSYVANNMTTLKDATQVSDFPSGYSDFFHDDYYAAGGGKFGEMIQRSKNFTGFLTASDTIEFENIKINFYDNDSLAYVMFDTIKNGEYTGDVKWNFVKDSDKWLIYGSQKDYWIKTSRDDDNRFKLKIINQKYFRTSKKSDGKDKIDYQNAHSILIKDGSDNVTVFTLESDETTKDTENNLSNIYKNEVSYKYQIAPIKKYQADVLDSSSNKIGNSIEVFF